MYYVGVDVVGTNLVAGLMNENCEILDKASHPVDHSQTAEQLCGEIVRLAKQVCQSGGVTEKEVRAVGIGLPGQVNNKTGIVVRTPNMPFQNTHVRQLFQRQWDMPVFLGNDADCAAIGEYRSGSAKGCSPAVTVTLGTGIGGGIIIDGKIFSGFNSAGAEIGHTVIVKGGRPCMCGRRGCWEKYASARALAEDTLAAMEQHKDNIMWSYVHGDPARVNAKTAFDAMRAGDALGTQVVQNFVEYVACGLTNLINIFQPEIICIGGGVSKEGDTLLAPVQAVVDQEDYAREGMRRTKIVTAKLRNDAGIIGAAGLATQHQ